MLDRRDLLVNLGTVTGAGLVLCTLVYLVSGVSLVSTHVGISNRACLCV